MELRGKRPSDFFSSGFSSLEKYIKNREDNVGQS
jgi:hypothetical protein